MNSLNQKKSLYTHYFSKQHLSKKLCALLLLAPAVQISADSWFNQFLNSALAYIPPVPQPASYQPAPSYPVFTQQEMRSYVDQEIEALDSALRSRMSSSDLKALKAAILSSIQQAQYAYQSNTGYGASNKVYKKDIIDQFIASAILEYIEKTAFNITYSRSNNRDLAQRISESMRNNALAIIAQNSVIDYERLAPFVGFALDRAINDQISASYNQNYSSYTPDLSYTKPDLSNTKPDLSYTKPDSLYTKPSSKPSKPSSSYAPAKPSAPAKPAAPVKPSKPVYQAPTAMPKPSAPPLEAQKLYTSTECVVCLEEFGGSVKRLYLKPCGHDICKQCAFDWFFGSNQKRTCPQCRANVNLDALQQDIV